MITAHSLKNSGTSILTFALGFALFGIPLNTPGVARSPQQESFQSTNDADRMDAEQERDQDKQDREQEKRDREQEKRDREQEKAERLEELYDEGREALDEGQYDKALKHFTELAQLNGPQTDAALYWKAYSENKRARKDAALATLADLNKRFPQSRWQKDASALAMEVRQSSGQKPNPDAQPDEELKLLALQGIMNGNPDQGIPKVEQVLNGSGSPQLKSQALFVLAQSGQPKAMEVVARVAQGQSNPELQRKAVEYLGTFGGHGSEKLLGQVYASTSDPRIKRAVLQGYMISGNTESLFNVAKNEKNEDLKREAIKQLGLVGGETQLEQLYQSETSSEVRREILQSFFLAGDSKRLVQAASNEKDPELRRAAINNLGLMGGDDASKALSAIYAKETDRSLKEEVLNAYFLEGNSAALVAIARAEKDPGLKKKAVEKLALMDDKNATEYMMELLQK